MDQEINPEPKLICETPQRNGVRLSSCAAPTDYQRSSQAFSLQNPRENALNLAAEQQKPHPEPVPPGRQADNRQPGHLFLRNLSAVFGPGGTKGCRGPSRLSHVRTALSDYMSWLRKNPKHKGVFGRLPVDEFKKTKRDSFSRSFWWQLRQDLLQADLISYDDDGVNMYVDFAHWDEPVAHAHYDKTRLDAATQKAKRRAVLRGSAAGSTPLLAAHLVQKKDSVPNRMAPTPPRDAEFYVSGHNIRASAPSVRPAPPAAASLAAPADRPGCHLQVNLKTQQPTSAPEPARAPEPRQAPEPAQAAEPVLAVGVLEKKKLGKAGSVVANAFLAFAATLPSTGPEQEEAITVVPERAPKPVPKPVPKPRRNYEGAALSPAERDCNPAGMTRADVEDINRDKKINLSWAILKNTEINYGDLLNAVLYATMAVEYDGKKWDSIEKIVFNSALKRSKGLWGASKSRRFRR